MDLIFWTNNEWLLSPPIIPLNFVKDFFIRKRKDIKSNKNINETRKQKNLMLNELEVTGDKMILKEIACMENLP